MKKYGLVLMLIGAMAFGLTSFKSEKPVDSVAGQLEWHTSLDEVYQISKESGKPIFGFFTGSDWCGWCHKLQRDVFAKQSFIDWAMSEVVLLELDFPKKKQLPDDLKQQNYDLQRAFGVTGYPTVWIFTAEKNEETNNYNLTALGKLGYPQGAVPGKEEEKFLKDANTILGK